MLGMVHVWNLYYISNGWAVLIMMGRFIFGKLNTAMVRWCFCLYDDLGVNVYVCVCEAPCKFKMN